MDCFISSIYYSPVKSLSFEKINSTIIKKNTGLTNDRIFSFSRIIDYEKARVVEKDPKKRKLNNFLTLKNTPVLNKYNFSFYKNSLILKSSNKIIFSISINNTDQHYHLCDELIKLEPSIKEPIFLLVNKIYPFFDTTPTNTISVININSIKDLEKKLSIKIEHERFRGNIYIDGLKAWEEFNLIGKKLKINNICFKVEKSIPRCSATNLKPNSDSVTMNLPMKLKKTYKHINMGIYLLPLEDGQINIDDNIKFL